jgi:hypothetical protein
MSTLTVSKINTSSNATPLLLNSGSNTAGIAIHGANGAIVITTPVPIVVTNSAKQTIWVPAGAMTPNTTSGPLANTWSFSTSIMTMPTLDFDASTEESAHFNIAMPSNWDLGNFTAKWLWSHPSTATNFNPVWGIKAQAFGDNDVLNTALGTEVNVVDVGGITNNLYLSPETGAISVTTPSSGDLVCFRVNRAAANGSDTLAVDARLHGLFLFYNTNRLSDT